MELAAATSRSIGLVIASLAGAGDEASVVGAVPPVLAAALSEFTGAFDLPRDLFESFDAVLERRVRPATRGN